MSLPPDKLIEVNPTSVEHCFDAAEGCEVYTITYSDGHVTKKSIRDDADLHDVQVLISHVAIHL